MHLAVLCSPVPGHIIPMTTLTNELIQRGHTVTIFSLTDTSSFVQERSPHAIVQIYGEKLFPKGSWNKYWGPLRSKSGDSVTLKTTKIHARVAQAMCDDIPSMIIKSNIDLLLIDQVQFHGRAIAEFTNCPFVTVSCAHPMNLSPNLPPPTQFGAPVNNGLKGLWYAFHRFLFRYLIKKQFFSCGKKLLQRKNLPMFKEVEESYSKVLHLIPSVPECDFPQQWQQPTHICYCGAFIPPDKKALSIIEKDEPLIYVSLGTIQNEDYRLLELICSATEELQIKTVVGLGQWDASKTISLPGNPTINPMAPQCKMLQRATLCISHGGYNTFNESLYYGVPLLIIPITNDQLGVGSRVESLGLGKTISRKKASNERLIKTIESLLSNQDCIKHVASISLKQRQAGGVVKAIQEIEKFLSRHCQFRR